MVSLLYAILQRDITIFQIAHQSPAAHTILIFLIRSRCLESILPHSLIGLSHVEIADSLHISIGEGYRTMVANHGCCIAVPTRKDGQPTALFIHCDQRLHHIC